MPLLWVCLNVQAPNCYWSYRFWGLSSNLFLEIPRYPRSPKTVKPLTCWNLIKRVVPAAVVPSRVVFGQWGRRWSKQELWVMDGLEWIGMDEFQNRLWWDVNQFEDSGLSELHMKRWDHCWFALEKISKGEKMRSVHQVLPRFPWNKLADTGYHPLVFFLLQNKKLY